MSIRRYLVLTLFSVLTLITFLAAIQGYKESMSIAKQQFDQQLLDLAQTLLAIQSVSDQNKTPDKTSDKTIQITQQGSFAFQVWTNQHLIIKSNNAPDQFISNPDGINAKTQTINISSTLAKKTPLAVSLFDINFSNQRWRALTLSPRAKQNSEEVVNIIVAQPIQTQFSLAQALILAAVTPMIIAIALLSILIFIIITQGLKPLHLLSDELAQRKSNDFRPLLLQVHNTELADTVMMLNQLFMRLDAAFQRERHFASDAAHELKTPLSVLKIELHNLIQDLGKRFAISGDDTLTPSEIQQFDSIKSLSNSVDRMGHVIDQLLNLNRTDIAQMQSDSHRFNINLLLKQVISELYNDILSKQQTITLNSDDVLLPAHEFSIHLLAVNLITNANKYTPVGGEISVSVNHVANQQLILCVEDSGTGIAPSEYQRVFDRFYRVGGDQHNSSVFGCGLGLTIVKHIVDLHGAHIKLSPSLKLKGLKVEVVFNLNEQKAKQDIGQISG